MLIGALKVPSGLLEAPSIVLLNLICAMIMQFKSLTSTLLVLISLVAFNIELSAQTEAPKVDSISAKQEKADYLDVVFLGLPEYVGGKGGLRKFIERNLCYPDNECVEGIVVVAYTITPAGNVVDVVVKVGLTEAINQEAIRLVSLLKYKPFDRTMSTRPIKRMLPIRFVPH